jgi:hypothetical protein
VPALWFAVLTGLFVALYTTYDAYGIRATADPFTFLAWFFFIDGLLFPFLAAAFYRRMAAPPPLGPLALRGVFGALVAFAASARSCWRPGSTRWARRRCCARPRRSSPR